MSKIYKNLTGILVLTAMIIAASGCLKDQLQDDNQSVPDIASSPRLIEIAGPTKRTNSFQSAYTISLPIGNNDTTFSLIYVKLAADQPASEDITVQLELVPELISAYNDSMDLDLDEPASSIYKLTPADLKVVIPKGSREGSLKITSNPNALITGPYAFGVRIKSVSGSGYIISGNFKNAVAVVGVRNKYDGEYTLKGFHNRPTLDRPYVETVHMVTTGPNSVKMFWPSLGSDAHPIDGGTTYYGTFSVDFNFDATEKLTSVTNPYGPTPVFTIGPATDSRYDPATKTIYAQFYYNGNLQRLFTDTLTFEKLRP